jgi:CubicO group peptidase (beta-lactamase class C family)
MRSIWVSVLAAAQFVMVVVSTASPSPRETLPTLRADVDRFVVDYLRDAGVRGAAVVVTKDRDVLLAKGYGTDSRGQPITVGTRLPIASLSKSFTSVAVMQLVERGDVSLDAPVVRYLPEFSLADARARYITVRQLLEHTSGLSDMAFHDKSGPIPDSLRAGVALLKTVKLSADPGTRNQYHNPNYWVAARLVEVVSGTSFRKYLRAHVFDPLGMSASMTVGGLREAPDVARGSVRFYGRLWSVSEPEWFLDGAAGVVTTADDLAKWLIVQNSGGVAANGERIVSALSVRQMHDGLGWRSKVSSGVREIGHEGLMATFTAQQLVLPQTGYGIGVIATRGFGLLPMDAEVIADEIAKITRGQPASTGAPIALIMEVIVGSLTLLSVLLAVRAWRRAPAWASRHVRRPRWRNMMTLSRPILPGLSWVRCRCSLEA